MNYGKQLLIGWISVITGLALIVSCLPFTLSTVVIGLLLLIAGIFMLIISC